MYHSPRRAKRFHLLLQSCRSECWPLRAPGRPTGCWAPRWSPWQPASCCCTTASSWASPRSCSIAELRCRCPCSRETIQSVTAPGRTCVKSSRYGCSEYTSLVSQMEMMKSKNGSSPAWCPGELSWTCETHSSTKVRGSERLDEDEQLRENVRHLNWPFNWCRKTGIGVIGDGSEAEMWLHIAKRAGYDHSFNVSQFIISMNAENVKKKKGPLHLLTKQKQKKSTWCILHLLCLTMSKFNSFFLRVTSLV